VCVFRHESGGERRRESVDMTGKAGQGPPRAEDDAMHDWHAGFTVRTVRLHPSSVACSEVGTALIKIRWTRDVAAPSY
jgi:hypothetical protein